MELVSEQAPKLSRFSQPGVSLTYLPLRSATEYEWVVPDVEEIELRKCYDGGDLLVVNFVPARADFVVFQEFLPQVLSALEVRRKGGRSPRSRALVLNQALSCFPRQNENRVHIAKSARVCLPSLLSVLWHEESQSLALLLRRPSASAFPAFFSELELTGERVGSSAEEALGGKPASGTTWRKVRECARAARCGRTELSKRRT